MGTRWSASQSKPFRIQCLPYKVEIVCGVRVDLGYRQPKTRWVVEISGREYGVINRVLLKRRPTEDSVLRVSWRPQVEGIAGGRRHVPVGTSVWLYNDECTPTMGPQEWDAYSRRLSELARWTWESNPDHYRAVGILCYNHATHVPSLNLPADRIVSQPARRANSGTYLKREQLIDLPHVPDEWLRKVFFLEESGWDQKDKIKPYPQETSTQKWALRLFYAALQAGLPAETDELRGWNVFTAASRWVVANWDKMGGNEKAYAKRRRRDGSRYLRKQVIGQIASGWQAGTTGFGNHIWMSPQGDYIFAYGAGAGSVALGKRMNG